MKLENIEESTNRVSLALQLPESENKNRESKSGKGWGREVCIHIRRLITKK